MKQYKFEVGKKYYDSTGRLHTCTKRTDKSVWFGEWRFNIKGTTGTEYTNGAYSVSADNFADEEHERIRALRELFAAVKKVCGMEPAECESEEEENIYEAAGDLMDCLEDYFGGMVDE